MELCQALAMRTFGTVIGLALRQNDPVQVPLFYLLNSRKRNISVIKQMICCLIIWCIYYRVYHRAKAVHK